MPDSINQSQELIWQIVNSIPCGKVATYGQIARLAGMPQQARMVGRVLSRLPVDTRLPWHRVINARGEISNPSPERQVGLLAQEGITLHQGKVNLSSCQWHPML